MNDQWKNWCRLCASYDANCSSVFENKDRLLPNKISRYLSISIEDDDEMPQSVCKLCCQKIKRFDLYADLCRKVQKMYKLLVEQSNDLECKIGLIREEFLQENEIKLFSLENFDCKAVAEVLNIETDTFICDDNLSEAKEKPKKRIPTKSKTSKGSRSRRVSKVVKTGAADEGGGMERRMSRRLQTIAQNQRDFAMEPDVEVKEEMLNDDFDDDADDQNDKASKKRSRTTNKMLVGAAKRKAKVPRVVKQEPETLDKNPVPQAEAENQYKVEIAKSPKTVEEATIAPEEPVDKVFSPPEKDETVAANDDSEEEKADDDKDASSQPPIFRWECHVCKEEFHNWNSLSVHCRQVHQVPAQVTCLCAKVLASRASIIKHRLKHTNAYKYRCEKCDKAFHRKSIFDLHMLSHVPKEEQPFVCCKCARRFHCEALLRHHERVHLPQEERLVYPCNICNKKFSSRSNVSAHLKAVHFGERPFVCDQCGHSFTSKGILQEHLTIHSDETPFKCTQCKKGFKTKYRLKIHMDTHRDTPYQCPLCPHQLSTRRTLRMHLLVHKDVKAYQCATCGKAFKRSKDLKNHHNLHTGRRPYTCTFCPRTFANGSNCRAHKRKMHPEELRVYEASLAAAAAGNGENVQVPNPDATSVNVSQTNVPNTSAPPPNVSQANIPPPKHSSVNAGSGDMRLGHHNSPAPEIEVVTSHPDMITTLHNAEFETRHTLYEVNGNVKPVHSVRQMGMPTMEYEETPPDVVMTQLVPASVEPTHMMALSTVSMVRMNDLCRGAQQQNLNIARHIGTLTPLNLNVTELHSGRHQQQLVESPSLADMEDQGYMAARRVAESFPNNRHHVANLNANMQLHHQHQNLGSIGQHAVAAAMVPNDALQGYTTLNLYQPHGEMAAMTVPAFPGNPYVHHNMGYNRGGNM